MLITEEEHIDSRLRAAQDIQDLLEVAIVSSHTIFNYDKLSCFLQLFAVVVIDVKMGEHVFDLIHAAVLEQAMLEIHAIMVIIELLFPNSYLYSMHDLF